MQKDKIKKISPLILFVVGTVLFTTAFTLITLTELGLLEYEVSRFMVIPVIAILSSLSLASAILYRKGFVKSISPEIDRKLFIVSMLLIGAASAMTFLSSIL